MSKLNSLSDRALALAGTVGENIKQAVPKAGHWLETGAKLGALRTGAKVAGGFVRRNPVIAVAAVAGAGLLWYAAHRRAKQAREAEQHEPIEGSAKRVDARRGERTATRKRTRAASSTSKRSNGGGEAHVE